MRSSNSMHASKSKRNATTIMLPHKIHKILPDDIEGGLVAGYS